MKKDRRWMKSIIAASVEQTVAFPWQRGTRTKPATLKAAPAPRSPSVAAR